MILLLVASAGVGFFGSFHCVGMCGGIVSVLSASVAKDLRRRPPVHLSFILAFNLGRMLSYAMLGATFGAFALGLQHVMMQAQTLLRAFAGVVLVGFGMHLAGGIRSWAGLERLGGVLWRPMSGWAKRLLPVRSLPHAAVLGALWGFIPCGMVYAAISLALASGGPIRGALSLAAFGAGTLPAMLAAGTVAGQLVAAMRRDAVRRAMGVAMALLGVCNVAFVVAERAHAGGALHPSCCVAHFDAP